MKLNVNSLSNKELLLFVYNSIDSVVTFGYTKVIKEVGE